ncbi:MAG: hypothetical protein U0869_20485 [Chloroflexota bacterium]
MRGRATVGALMVMGLVAASAATPAAAVFPGENGRVVYVSGRGEASDASAKVYVQTVPGTDGTVLDTRSGQHRHPSWSPDQKRIAYALWDGSSNEKVWYQALADGIPHRVGQGSSIVRDDRPSWSPDGTRIAYESEVSDGSGQMDILVTDISDSPSGPTINLTSSPNAIEGKPVWSPDGRWIYFSRRIIPSTDDDILRIRSDGSQTIPESVVNSATAEYQAALSPDGKRLCYTRGPFGSSDADVWVMDLGNPPGVDFSNTTLGAYNCVWSPDGKSIAYARGTFSNGALVVKALAGGDATLLAPDAPGHFDGNPDWAPKHPPYCRGVLATKVGTDGPNHLSGTGGRDVIQGFGGNDVIKGLGGNDLLCGGKGSDRLEGGNGADFHDGGPGTDTCIGGPGVDRARSCER